MNASSILYIWLPHQIPAFHKLIDGMGNMRFGKKFVFRNIPGRIPFPFFQKKQDLDLYFVQSIFFGNQIAHFFIKLFELLSI
jgi:hypothetical protein